MADQLPAAAGPVGDLPEQAIDAATDAICIHSGLECLAVEQHRKQAEAALTAALPAIRAHIADQITAEMLAVNTRYIGSEVAAAGYVDGLTVAARVARGGNDGD